MGNKFASAEARKHWYEYNSAYSKKHYKTITFKFHRENEKEIVDYIESLGEHSGLKLKKLLIKAIKEEQ